MGRGGIGGCGHILLGWRIYHFLNSSLNGITGLKGLEILSGTNYSYAWPLDAFHKAICDFYEISYTPFSKYKGNKKSKVWKIRGAETII